MQRAARAVLAALLLLAVAPASAPLAAPPGRRDYLACVVLGHHAQRRHHQHLVADLRRARGQRAARRSAERTRLGGDRAVGGRGWARPCPPTHVVGAALVIAGVVLTTTR